MRILILGGGGFLGRRLAREILETGGGAGLDEWSSLTLVDLSFPDQTVADSRIEYVKADFSEERVARQLLSQKPDLIFHLAAVVSGEAEKNFDLGMKVNFHASLQLLELCRALAIRPRIVFASSCAVFGGDVSKTIVDETGPKPLSSYGTQKAMVELLLNDYSRRGFVDARSLRLPTIAVRPGKPNAATSSFVSSIIREPLHGLPATYPVPADTEVWIQSPRQVIRNFIHAASIEEKVLGHDRVINLPGLTVSIGEMISSLQEIAGERRVKLISNVPDKFLQSIVLTWPPHFDTARAGQLGFVNDTSATDIIKLYIREEGITL